MITAGITGGIASGKSVVCEVFKLLGVPVYNADTAAKVLANTDREIKNDLIKLFGDDIYEGNNLNRKKLSEIIFNNKTALENTNKIIHPRVIKDFLRWAEEHKDHKYILMEAAILYESGTYKMLDKVITVTAPKQIRISRALSRENFTKQIIENIQKNQILDEEKVKRSHYVILNDNKTLILPQILRIHQQLLNINRA